MSRQKTLRTCLMMLAAAFLVFACGNRGPLSPESKTGGQENASSRTYAAKPGGQKHVTTTSEEAGVTSMSETLYVQSDHGNFSSHQGGSLRVTMPNYGDASTVRVKKVLFDVLPGSMEQNKARITMTVYSGQTLGDVWVSFDPSGLTFKPGAKLKLYLQGPVTEQDVRNAYHIYGNGSNVEQIATEITSSGEAYLIVEFDVPGFSQYSLGGEDTPEVF